MAPRNDPAGEPEPSFEAALERLESIVDDLEGGTLTLEESLRRYEEGMKLSKRLSRTLDEAEKAIERLEATGDDAPPASGSEPSGGRSAKSGPRPIELESGRGGESELPF